MNQTRRAPRVPHCSHEPKASSGTRRVAYYCTQQTKQQQHICCKFAPSAAFAEGHDRLRGTRGDAHGALQRLRGGAPPSRTARVSAPRRGATSSSSSKAPVHDPSRGARADSGATACEHGRLRLATAVGDAECSGLPLFQGSPAEARRCRNVARWSRVRRALWKVTAQQHGAVVVRGV